MSYLLKFLNIIFRLIIVLVVIAGAVGISYYWISNPPTTERRPPKPESVLVTVEKVSRQAERALLKTLGTVIPAKQIQLAARITGQVTEVNGSFVPGGIFKANEVILQIDKEDYELAVAQQSANLTQAQADVRIEMGQQEVARSEYELLMGDVEAGDLDLLLRKPQLEARKAAVAIAEAALERAELNLDRTTIYAPFNAVVIDRNVELGAYVSPGNPLATLADTDLFWVEVSIPAGELRWIQAGEKEGEAASTVRVYDAAAWGEGVYREGYVQQVLPDIEVEGRMARVLVAVTDPLALNTEESKGAALRLNAFVRVIIEGTEIPGVVRIPRAALRENNTVWVMTAEKTLDIRDVEIVWSSEDEVFISGGMGDGELLVTSDMATPVQGTLLRTSPVSGEKGGGGKAKAAGGRDS